MSTLAFDWFRVRNTIVSVDGGQACLLPQVA